MVAGLHEVGYFWLGNDHADGSAGTGDLGDSHDVGSNVEILIAEPFAGAAYAGLDFVADEKAVSFRAEFSELLHVFLRRDVDAAFALNGLKDHCYGLIVYGLFHGSDVIVWNVGETGNQGSEGSLVLFLGGGGEGAEGPAMERICGGDEFILCFGLVLAPIPCDFHGAFYGFCAGIAEEDLAGERMLDDKLGQFGLKLVVVVVRKMDELFGLIFYGLHYLGVAVAQEACPPSGEKVKVLVAVFVEEPGSLAFYEGGFDPGVGLHDVAVVIVVNIHTYFTFSKFIISNIMCF